MIALFLSAVFPLCRKFKCRDPADPQNPEICSKLEKGPTEWIEYVGSCGTLFSQFFPIEPTKTCPIHDNDVESKRCIDNPEMITWPGQKANSTEKCMTGKVVDGFCRGKALNEACAHHMECDVGLRCGLNLVCEPGSEYLGDCNDEFNPCQSYLYCREGYCMKYGSLEIGDSIGRGSADLCKTRYADNHGVCQQATYLRGPVLRENENETCSYENGVTEKAKCGFNSEGKAICKPGPLNLTTEWEQVKNIYKLY